MMTIQQHPGSPKYVIVKNPTADAVKRAQELTPGNWARIEKSGSITVHVNFRRDFERLLQAQSTGATVRRYVSAEEFEDGVGACVGWNIIENAGTDQAIWRKA